MSASKQNRIVPLILAGGSGTRLWPLSRESLPKQFVPLIGDLSSFQETLRRVGDPRLFEDPVVVTRSDFRFYAEQQAKSVGCKATILLEPEGRDSAAAIASGTVFVARDRPDAIVLCLAADHVIPEPEIFIEDCLIARDLAAAGRIVTFGVRPSEAKTSYGYIKPGARLGPGAFEVAAFTEKPDPAAAAEFVAAGHLWNSGNFMFDVSAMRRELELHAPDVAGPAAEAVENAAADLAFIRLGHEAYARTRRVSIDYAVMEKTKAAAVVEGRFRWSDVGSWDAVWALSHRDPAGNAAVGSIELLDAQGTLAYSDGPLLAVCGMKDVVAVATKDAILVVDRSRAEDVKALVGQLAKANRREVSEHRRVRRPWGHYESIDEGSRFQVKRIVVAAGQKLSLQKHLHRAEHWVVVRGTAEVTIDEKLSLLRENESIFVPVGAVHRLRNPGRIPLELIEVQTGSYLGEDDIIRFEDDFGRESALNAI
jgi:mannose-1-phosphate guanylyltransferase / mannose-6-phosphate isomerase